MTGGRHAQCFELIRVRRADQNGKAGDTQHTCDTAMNDDAFMTRRVSQLPLAPPFCTRKYCVSIL